MLPPQPPARLRRGGVRHASFSRFSELFFVAPVARPGAPAPAWPQLDLHWENHPAHFWLVLVTGVITGALAFLTGEAAARRGDARVLRLSIAFFAPPASSACTRSPRRASSSRVRTPGFQAASAIGLLLASPIAAWSAADLGERSSSLVGRRWVHLPGPRARHRALGRVCRSRPCRRSTSRSRTRARCSSRSSRRRSLFYARAAVGYVRLYRRRQRPLLLAAVGAFVLLAEAMLAIALGVTGI